MKIKTALQWGRQTLQRSSDTPHLDTMVLLSYVLQVSQTTLIVNPEKQLSSSQKETFETLIHRRASQEPIPYLVGFCEFWSLQLQVTPDCLIPRPETEILVEQVLTHYPKEQSIRLADLGTGSGAIAIALASERPAWHIIATDRSKKALNIAQSNAKQLAIKNIEFKQGDWLNPLSAYNAFDGIISNPPYLTSYDSHLDSSLRYEPQDALVSQEEGFADLHHLIKYSRDYLKPGGCLWLEHGYNQSDKIKSDFHHYQYTDIRQYRDLSGIMRVSSGCYIAKITELV
jgi:release factor glutamine methyltransferase